MLSNPARRAEYDAACKIEAPQQAPLSTSIDFMDGIEGELNRRLAVLPVLYFRRRSDLCAPEVSLAEIEKRMGFPRDYIDSTTWYLQKKGYITRADNSDFTLTAQGVDFVETQRVHIPILNKLLTNGAHPPTPNGAAANTGFNSQPTPRFVHAETEQPTDRRRNSTDRRYSIFGR